MIHFGRYRYRSTGTCECEPGITIDFLCAKAGDLLDLIFLQECIIHFTNHRDPATSCLRLRSVDVEVGPRIIHLTVYKAVIDIDDPVLEIQVLPS